VSVELSSLRLLWFCLTTVIGLMINQIICTLKASAKVEVNIGECSPNVHWAWDKCFSIISRGEYEELQNNGLDRKNADANCLFAAIVQ